MPAAGWWSSWSSKKSWRASEQRRRQSRRAPVAIECLEDRRLLSGIQFSQSVYRIAEGTRTLDVTLTREGWTSGSDSVLIVETGGTATGGGSDYWSGAFPVNAIFRPGEREHTVTLVLMSPRGDQFLEGVETIELGLVDNDHYNVTFGEQRPPRSRSTTHFSRSNPSLSMYSKTGDRTDSTWCSTWPMGLH